MVLIFCCRGIDHVWCGISLFSRRQIYLLYAVLFVLGDSEWNWRWVISVLGGKILKFLSTTSAKFVSASILTIVLMAICAAPFITTRWRSLERGYSGFVSEDYVYPVLRPHEARIAAECALSKVAETSAFLVLDWRALYSIYYVAYLEQGRTRNCYS